LARTWQFGQYTLLARGMTIALLSEFETWLLPKGRHREGEGDIMDGYFFMAPSPIVWRQKMVTKQSKKQWAFVDVTTPVATNDQSKIYIILENKPLRK
jgi:hypothetical protein